MRVGWSLDGMINAIPFGAIPHQNEKDHRSAPSGLAYAAQCRLSGLLKTLAAYAHLQWNWEDYQIPTSWIAS
jgi:hypothetical protein